MSKIKFQSGTKVAPFGVIRTVSTWYIRIYTLEPPIRRSSPSAKTPTSQKNWGVEKNFFPADWLKKTTIFGFWKFSWRIRVLHIEMIRMVPNTCVFGVGCGEMWTVLCWSQISSPLFSPMSFITCHPTTCAHNDVLGVSTEKLQELRKNLEMSKRGKQIYQKNTNSTSHCFRRFDFKCRPHWVDQGLYQH